MSNVHLSLLARLAMKTRQELQSIFNESPSSQNIPLEWAVKLADARTAMSFNSDREPGTDISFTQGPRSYELQIRGNVHVLNDALVVLKMQRQGYPANITAIKGADLLNLSPTLEFKELHEAAIAHVKQFYAFDTTGTGSTAGAPPAASASNSSATEEADGVSSRTEQGGAYVWRTVCRENLPNLKFKGRVIARVGTSMRNGRQHVYSVHQTESGTQVGVKQGISRWLNEKELCQAEVLEDDAKLVGFFGYGALAKCLYQELGLATCAEELIE